MGNVSRYDREESGEAVVIGDDAVSSQISFQMAQDFYNEISGKTENTKEYFSDSFILTLDNVEQLDNRIRQSTEQYNICTSNESYSVKYMDYGAERFSSIDRLKLHVDGRGAAVEQIDIQYNLLIVLPKTNRPQEYKISITLASRVAKIEGMREELGPVSLQIPLYQFERIKTAVFSIDYVDITVANAIMSVVTKWFSSLEREEISPVLKFSRKLSRYFSPIFSYALLSLVVYYSYILSEIYIPVGSTDLRVLSVFSLGVVAIAFVMFRIGSYLGKKSEVNLDSIYEHSYIRFSAADDNFVKSSSSKSRLNGYKFIGSTLFALIVGITGSVIASTLSS